MRALVVVMMVAAGCGSSVDPGPPCGTGPACGDGEVCDLTDPGGATCIAGDGDLDGDGLANSVDHCAHLMGGKFDEDGDGIGDDCDRCPIAAPLVTPDQDNDEVDSPCDPDSHMDGDKILLFDGFQNATLDTRWTPTTASAWSIHDGELVVTLSSVATEDYLKTAVAAANSLAVETSYKVDKVETSSATHVIAVHADDPRPAGVAHMECGVVRSDVGTGEIVDLETNQGAMTKAATGAFESSKLYRVAANAAGTTVGCTVIGGGQALGTVQAPITPDAMQGVSLGARSVTARFQWFLVMGR